MDVYASMLTFSGTMNACVCATAFENSDVHQNVLCTLCLLVLVSHSQMN